MNEKLLHVTFGYETTYLVQMFVLFTDYTIDKEEHTSRSRSTKSIRIYSTGLPANYKI